MSRIKFTDEDVDRAADRTQILIDQGPKTALEVWTSATCAILAFYGDGMKARLAETIMALDDDE